MYTSYGGLNYEGAEIEEISGGGLNPGSIAAITGGVFWGKSREAISLSHINCCGDGVRLAKRQVDYFIALPPNRNKYEITVILKLINKADCPAEIEFRRENRMGGVFSKRYCVSQKKQDINIHDRMILDAEGKGESLLSLALLSSPAIEVRAGEVRVAKIESMESVV